ncbi:MAG: CoA transferase [Betaproteobacteria bacterium]|nr:MAG: CoA transferase [Betaproteobacteria bacterium]
MDGILSELKVLELAHAPSGAFCAKLLADQGADTIKLEPPGWGDQARHEPPFIGGEPHPDRSTTFLALNTNKRGITLDIEQPAARSLFFRLARTADVVIESFQPGRLNQLGLGYEALQAENPKAILLSITYFGQHGPYAHYKGDDLIAQAMGGYLYAVTGSADRPPMGTALQQMELTAARNGVIAVMAALLHRDQTGEGGHIDLSVMEAAVSTPSGLIHPYSYTGRNPHRGSGDRFVMDGMHLPTRDGEVTLTTAGTGGRPMEAWAEFLNEPRLLDPKFATRQSRDDNWEALRDLVAPKLAEWNNLDLMRETMARGLVIGLVQSPEQVVSSPHLAERGFFVALDHPEVGTLEYPGSGFFFDGANRMQTTRAAPRLGEHNAEVYCGPLGLTSEELGRLRAARTV